MIGQSTIGSVVTVAGAGLHTGCRSTVTLHPAPAGHGRRIVQLADPTRPPSAMTWVNRVPSLMSTSIAVSGHRAVRTVEHLMAALSAFAIDNVLVVIDGDEIPILDGSARPWCRRLAAVGRTVQSAPRRFIRVVRPVQVWQDRGFLRIEPADRTSADVTFELAPDLPVQRWSGPVSAQRFVADLAGARSFGRLDWRRLLRRPAASPRPPGGEGELVPHRPDAALLHRNPAALWSRLRAQKAAVDADAPVLRGARPGRATLVVQGHMLPAARYPDEPVRHIVLDMLGDLALAGAPILGHVTAHAPSHEKTYMLVAALMCDRSAWIFTTGEGDAT